MLKIYAKYTGFYQIFLLSAFTLICFFNHPAHSANSKKSVLVLHSYHQGLEWTDNISKGIQSTFRQYHNQYELFYEYLDTKRNFGKEYTTKQLEYLLTKNQKNNYDAIIVSDNNAFNFIKRNRNQLFPNHTPIIFCGVNNFQDALIDDMNNVTGVVEATDFKATISLMQKLHPEKNKVMVILDKTPTGNAIYSEIKNTESVFNGQVEFDYYRDFLLNDVADRVSKLDNNYLIYLLAFNRDKNNNFISYTDGVHMISKHTNTPIYGSWDFYMGKGILGGIITSGFLQGQQAAKIALRVLNGESANNIPVIKDSPTQAMFDYQQLQKFGIKTHQLPYNSTIINPPPSNYETYKGVLVAITALTFSACLILFWKYTKQKMRLKIHKNANARLEIIVKERTLKLETANKVLERMSNQDGLTKLYNRRYFDLQLQNEIKKLQRVQLPLSVLMCDLDYFKEYNDTYGHVAGDIYLKGVAQAINNNCQRISDTPARYGGDEFAIILPNTKAKDALRIAQMIAADLEKQNILHASSPIKTVASVSIGVATIIPAMTTSPSSVLILADKALYESKENGKDRVTVHDQTL